MQSLSRFLWALVWIGLAIYLAFTLWLGYVGLVYPYQLDYGEGIVLWFAQEIARGHSIYTFPGAPLYASSNYPPVAMLLSAALMPLFGDGYVGGRLLNFASAQIVAALIYRIVRVEARDQRAAALAALFFIGSPYVYHWVPLFRADLIGLAFAMTGIYFAWEYGRMPENDKRKRSYFWLCVFSFLLALYTKHTLFAAPAATFLVMFARDKRAAITFALALVALGGAIYFALDAATGGGFTFGLITSNATVFLPEQLAALLRNFAVTFPILLLLALWGWVARVRARHIGALEWYALISFAALALAGRVGAWENYFFEALATTCVFAGIAVARWQSSVAGQLSFVLRRSSFVLPLLLLIQLVLMWHDPRIAADLVARDLPANQQLDARLARTPGAILSEDMGALATSGKEVAYYTFQYSSLARSGKWDQSWELNGLRDANFPLVILERGTREDVDRYRRFTREFVSTLDRYYEREQVIGKYEIYRPAPLAHLQSADFGAAIALVGWTAQPETLQPGTLRLTVVWQARRAMTRRYTAFAHLENAAREKIAQDDREPGGGIYPTTRWAANEIVREVYVLNVPENLAGNYFLRVGWYDSETGDRLPVPGSEDDAVVLGAYQIK